jgi:hypothetical protein
MPRDSDRTALQACCCASMLKFMATALQTRCEGHYPPRHFIYSSTVCVVSLGIATLRRKARYSKRSKLYKHVEMTGDLRETEIENIVKCRERDSVWCCFPDCSLWYTSALKGCDFETVYTTSSENKQGRHYRVNICFILLLMTSLRGGEKISTHSSPRHNNNTRM